jgi:hypothetical protein
VKLRIGTILPLIISALVVIGVASAGFTAYRAYGNRQQSEAFLRVNQISRLLLRSSGQWAIERGLTNASLKAPEVRSAERREEIVKTRAVADQAFREAVVRLREGPVLKAVEQRITDAENAFQGSSPFAARWMKTLRRADRNARPRWSRDFRLPLPI